MDDPDDIGTQDANGPANAAPDDSVAHDALAAAAPDGLVDRETLNDVGATKSPLAKADPAERPSSGRSRASRAAEVHLAVAEGGVQEPSPETEEKKPQPETETKSLDALLAALNGSAERFQTLWFSFLGLTLYLAIAALATTHRNLLLGEPQTLPILNIKVELLPFYIIAPLLYFVFHFYLLMMLVLLARTAAQFETELRNTKVFRDEADREHYRARVENALFLQLLVGMKDERAGVNSLLLATIALITIVLAPIATLILMQMMFLPYHSFGITWWHRALVIADVVVVLIMWRRFFYDSGIDNPLLIFRDRPRRREVLAFVANVGLIWIVLWLSLGEGRWAGEDQEWVTNFNATKSGVVFGLFPDRLILPNEIIVGGSRVEEINKERASRGREFIPTRDFSGRYLQGAVFFGADLRGVQLVGAQLQRAVLATARLDGAALNDAQLEGADLRGAKMPSAGLDGAFLQGAILEGAEMTGARLQQTVLREANLIGANLQGADLSQAQLQGDDLGQAQLLGANLGQAQLMGANLIGAQLQGANLQEAQLQGANLAQAQLQGANLVQAQLQGADLSHAQLQGADFWRADIEGADLDYDDVEDADLSEAYIFRTGVAGANMGTAAIQFPRVVSVDEGMVPMWITAATKLAPMDLGDYVANKFVRLKKDFQTPDLDAAEVAKWQSLEDSYRSGDPDGAQHRQRLAIFLGNLACGHDGASYVARGLIWSYRLKALGDQLGAFRARIEEGRKNIEKCPGVAGFTEEDLRRLAAIEPARDNTAPKPAPSPTPSR